MVYQTVVRLLSEILSQDPENMSPGFKLSQVNRVEPLDIAKLAMACEAHWGIVLRDEEIANWRTLGNVVITIARLLEAGEDQALERDEADRLAWFYE